MSYHNLATVYEDEAEFENAKNNFNKAISINPNDYESIHGISLIQLSELDYKNGWKNYESRFLISSEKNKSKHVNMPRLKSLENLDKKKIIVWHEQGLGDTIQFSRYVYELISLGPRITFEVQSELKSFMSRQFMHHINAGSEIVIFKSLYYPYLIYSTNQINAFLKSLIF